MYTSFGGKVSVYYSFHPTVIQVVPSLYPNFINGKLLDENEACDNKIREWLVLISSHIRALMHAPCPSTFCPFSPLFAPLFLHTIFLGQVNGVVVTSGSEENILPEEKGIEERERKKKKRKKYVI